MSTNASAATHRNSGHPKHGHLQHLGMQVEGVRARGVQGRILVTRNLANGRRWLIDPATGIGEPAPEEPAPPVLEVPGLGVAAVAAVAARPKPARRSSGGPFVCEQCGEKHLFVLRFPDGTVMSKCLSCRKFVVDGQVERAAARAVTKTRRPQRFWHRGKRKVELPGLPLEGSSPEALPELPRDPA